MDYTRKVEFALDNVMWKWAYNNVVCAVEQVLNKFTLQPDDEIVLKDCRTKLLLCKYHKDYEDSYDFSKMQTFIDLAVIIYNVFLRYNI